MATITRRLKEELNRCWRPPMQYDICTHCALLPQELDDTKVIASVQNIDGVIHVTPHRVKHLHDSTCRSVKWLVP